MLGLLAALFAYSLGRLTIRLRREKQPYRKALTWVLRTVVCVFAVLWQRGLDATSIATLVLVVAAFALGAYLEWRPRHVEEIHLFPD
jgi:hypothetical protein